MQAPWSRDRGIGRYVTGLLDQLLAHHPDEIHSVLIHPRGGIVPRFTTGPYRPLVQAHRRHAPLDQQGRPPDTYLVASPFDLDAHTDTVWPAWARGGAVTAAAIVQDLIPARFPDQYLPSPSTHGRYWSRLKMLRHFDVLLCPSEATKQDLVEIAEISPETVAVIGAAAAAHFRPPDRPSTAGVGLRSALPALQKPFIMYTAGEDSRKNIAGLFRAFALLDLDLRHSLQLVIVCGLTDIGRLRYQLLADELEIGDSVIMTGAVSDGVLLALYQSTELFVFPSLYEGFGLPVVEAIESGAPAIVSDVSSLPEIVADPRFRFPPADEVAMAATIQAILTTGDRDEIAASQRAYVEGRHTWTHVATRLLNAITSAPNRTHHTSTSSRRDIALITPVPPQASGIADYSMRLARALAEHVTVDLIPQRVPGDAGGPFDGIEMIDIREFLRRDERSSYFAAIYVMGNSAFHHYSLEAMQYRRGTVLLHEARYTGLFASYAIERGSGIDWFTDLLASEYPGCAIGSGEFPSYWDLANVGVYLCGPIVDRADRILTTSMLTADVVRLERPRRSPDVTCVGFGFPTLHTEYPRSGLAPFTVGTFGMQSEVKATDLVIEAFAEVRSRIGDARLIIAGETDFGYRRHLEEMVAKHHMQGAVSFLGRLSADDYWRAAASCNVGVQLRRATNGEVSAAVADLFALGVPVIVSDIGPNSDLPNDAVLKAAVQATPGELAHLIVDLHESPDRARSVAMRARVYAKEHDMAWAAAALLGAL